MIVNKRQNLTGLDIGNIVVLNFVLKNIYFYA